MLAASVHWAPTDFQQGIPRQPPMKSLEFPGKMWLDLEAPGHVTSRADLKDFAWQLPRSAAGIPRAQGNLTWRGKALAALAAPWISGIKRREKRFRLPGPGSLRASLLPANPLPAASLLSSPS